MLFDLQQEKDYSVFALRRKDLLQAVKEKYSEQSGLIVLFAGFEQERIPFRQESSFYYFTGIREPGVVVTIAVDGKATLYIPNCGDQRSKWVAGSLATTKEQAKAYGLDEITVLGDACPGYQFHPFFAKNTYQKFLDRLQELVTNKQKLFTLCPDNAHEYIEQRLVLQRVQSFVSGLQQETVNVADVVAQMRRKKDMQEIEQLYKAIEITGLAHEAAAQAIEDGVTECEVQASLEYMMTGSCTRPSFPSIVASGKNGTILHYIENSKTIKNGELVIVDIGAEYNGYAADLTRTYPVSGTFTKRQRELYDIVLQTQQHIADVAKPGYWLNNKEQPEKSLHHLAVKFLKEKKYDKYFVHGIGHYLGLDVHDVGDYKKPLQEGDVITIEPGIYIPEEGIGIRIEDDYWVVKDGVVCLSEDLPKQADEIEKLMQQGSEDEDDLPELSDLDLDELDQEVEH